jgi:hypothetical protein
LAFTGPSSKLAASRKVVVPEINLVKNARGVILFT